jgi:hypothetical protein
VGREHGLGGKYTPELRLNPSEAIEKYLAEEEDRKSENRRLQVDSKTLIEQPPSGADRMWLIVYLLDEGLQFSLGYKRHDWWLADVVSFGRTKDGAFVVRDLMLDVEIDRRLDYRILDHDEFD